jgi:hypothetical protein
MEGRNLAAEYDYTVPWQDGYSWLLVAAILLVTFLSVAAIEIYYRKYPAKNNLIVAEQAVQAVFNPLIILIVAVSLVSIILQAHGKYLLDNIFFAVATLLFGGICWYGVNHNRDGQPPIVTKAIIRDNWPDYLQTFFWALTYYACCTYVNALYSAQQHIAQNKQIIFFSLAVLAMMRRREIFRYINLLYLTIAGGLAYYRYDEQIKAGMDELSKNDITIIGLTTWVNLIGGLVVLNVLINLIGRLWKKEMKPVSFAFSGLVLLFFVLIIVFRNEQIWPIILVICFAVYYLQYGTETRGKVVLNVCRGLVLQFIWMVGYSLLFRPFATYRSIRFPMGFHTVTVTATYLAMVIVAALVIFLAKYRKSSQLKDLWKESVLLGVALSYEFLTITRTGYFTVLMTLVFVLLFLMAGKRKQRRRNTLRVAGFWIMSFLLCFPVVFYLQRTIPALVSNPHIYAIESYFQETTRGRELSSFQYARVGRFIEVFVSDIFNIPEGMDIYRMNQREEQLVVLADGTVMPGDEAEARGIESVMTVKEKIEELREVDAEEVIDFQDSLGLKPDNYIEPVRDYTSGRMDIFKTYIAEFNMTGHDGGDIVLPDGTSPYHAHNDYIQMTYEFGIPVGVLFVLVGGVAFVRAIFYYRKNRGSNGYAAFPLLVIVAFAVAGITEVSFGFSNPSGFLLMLVVAPLIYRS